MINQERLLNEFLELVQIDSETKYETEIAKVLKQKFTDLGVDVFEDDTILLQVMERVISFVICLVQKRV